jgi:hypothetical protein
MKKIFLLLFSICNSYASDKIPCELDSFFRKTDAYSLILLENKAKLLELERERISLLPDINVSISQQSTNNNSFKDVMNSSLSLGFSQSVYSGNSYSKYKSKIAKDIEYNNLMTDDKRNRYLVDLYRFVIEYNYQNDLFNLYTSQLEKQKTQLEVSKLMLQSGDIAKIEYDIISLRKEELQNNVNSIKNDVRQIELDIHSQFSIPVGYITKITSEQIQSCKKIGISQILDESKLLLHQSEYENFRLKLASLQPNVGLSLHMRPPVSGTLRDISTKKTEFVAGINVTVPISSFFNVNNIKKEHAISISRIKNTYSEKQKLHQREKENVISKINILKSRIDLTRKTVELKGKEVDYIFSRFREKKETIMSYYRQLDEYEHEKINLKKDEREYEFYKTYISILD